MIDPWWRYSPITRQDIIRFLLVVVGGEVAFFGGYFLLEQLGTLLTRSEKPPPFLLGYFCDTKNTCEKDWLALVGLRTAPGPFASTSGPPRGAVRDLSRY